MFPGSQKTFFNLLLTWAAVSSKSIFESSSEELIFDPVSPGTENKYEVVKGFIDKYMAPWKTWHQLATAIVQDKFNSDPFNQVTWLNLLIT